MPYLLISSVTRASEFGKVSSIRFLLNPQDARGVLRFVEPITKAMCERLRAEGLLYDIVVGVPSAGSQYADALCSVASSREHRIMPSLLLEKRDEAGNFNFTCPQENMGATSRARH